MTSILQKSINQRTKGEKRKKIISKENSELLPLEVIHGLLLSKVHIRRGKKSVVQVRDGCLQTGRFLEMVDLLHHMVEIKQKEENISQGAFEFLNAKRELTEERRMNECKIYTMTNMM